MQFDVTFPAVRCSILSLDAMDISGEKHFDIVCTTQISFLSIKFSVHVILSLSHFYIIINLHYTVLYLQRHNIMKKRIDANGNVIEMRKDGIGAPKVS